MFVRVLSKEIEERGKRCRKRVRQTEKEGGGRMASNKHHNEIGLFSHYPGSMCQGNTICVKLGFFLENQAEM